MGRERGGVTVSRSREACKRRRKKEKHALGVMLSYSFSLFFFGGVQHKKVCVCMSMCLIWELEEVSGEA